MANQLFHYQLSDLHELSQKVVQMAREAGATQASAEVSESAGLSVTVRMADIDTLEQTRD
ncbi:MAG: metalloprotease PmbA, partial [Burkholderiaceae bacterium]